MITPQENEYLTRVGPGTPGGNLMRKYWHPVSTLVSLVQQPVQKVTILGESLVLYRDRSGQVGLVQERCPHRRTSLALAIPESKGIRCCYHGWLFDAEGRCLETPLEPPDSKFKERIAITAYPVEELGGLVWAYLGGDHPPLLPKWELFQDDGSFRQIVGHILPCNWLQVQENRADLGHAPFLHGYLFRDVLERSGRLDDDPEAFYNVQYNLQRNRSLRESYQRYRPIPNEFGLTKGMLDSDGDESSAAWTVGLNPILFPYLLAFGPGGGIRRSYQMGVPLDDEHTWHIEYISYHFPPEVNPPAQEIVPYIQVPLKGEDGQPILDYVLGQDMVAWYGQGTIADRPSENLGVSDRVVTAYRKLLRDQIKRVEDGLEPINRFWDSESASSPELRIPGFDRQAESAYGAGREFRSLRRERLHQTRADGRTYLDDEVDRYLPDRELILALYRATEALDHASEDRA